ncbi:MAG: hypothetical protein JWN15_4127 [Firmicutes bacterium]|nr:hypothetical protein [Bacillota bacterium]
MVEKVVRSLQDLEDALALAAGQGECRIKVGNRVAVLVASESLSDQQTDEFLNQPAVVQRLDKAARSLQEGRGISHADVVKRFGHGKV